MKKIVSIQNLNKTYRDGFIALSDVSFDIEQGEIFALLGPNGAGKTSLINSICGLSRITQGKVIVDGFNVATQFKKARELIGLVPQELALGAFETVWDNVVFTRALFGKRKNPDIIEQILKDLSLWDKRKNKIITLSGGMKRRLMIAKALSHEPKILFLDEPTAGVDVELRKGMWKLVQKLKDSGVTIILTTHYLEEAQEMADRIGVILNGNLLLLDKKDAMIKKLGKRQLILEINDHNFVIPSELEKYDIHKKDNSMIISYDSNNKNLNIQELINAIHQSKISYNHLYTKESSLEEIFVELVKDK